MNFFFRIHIFFAKYIYAKHAKSLHIHCSVYIAYTHTLNIKDIYICVHTYIYANYAFTQICIHKHAFPCISGCIHILTHVCSSKLPD